MLAGRAILDMSRDVVAFGTLELNMEQPVELLGGRAQAHDGVSNRRLPIIPGDELRLSL